MGAALFVGGFQPREAKALDFGREGFGVARSKERGRRRTAGLADVKASGGIGLVVYVGEIRYGARAAGGAADALELPVCAAGAAVKVLDVAVLGRRMHRREVGKPAADGADERTVVVRHVVGTIDRGRGLRGESVEMGAKRKAENGEDVVGEKVVAFGRFFHAVEIVGRARTGDLDEVGRRKARPVDRLHRVRETPFGVRGVVEHDGEFPNDLFEFRRIDRDGAVGEERAVGADERLFDARLQVFKLGIDPGQLDLAGVALFAVVELYYRKKLFKNLEVVTDMDFGRRLTPLQSIVARKSREKVMALIVLWAVFAVLVPLNAYMEQYSLALMVLSGGLALVGVYFCVLHIVALTRMK